MFPLVQSAYRQTFWPELIEYVDKNEATLLKTCNNKNTKSAVRGWIFEELVIIRFQRHDIETSTAIRGLLIPSCKVVEFRTLSGMYNFPVLEKEKKSESNMGAIIGKLRCS